MENKTYIAITTSAEYEASLTADEKTFLSVCNCRNSDKKIGEILGWSKSKVYRVKWSAFGKKNTLGTRTEMSFK